jgi:uncharacterized membrane protein
MNILAGIMLLALGIGIWITWLYPVYLAVIMLFVLAGEIYEKVKQRRSR